MASFEPTHGLSLTSEHMTWRAIRQRCENRHHSSYKNYGGRGVTVCERWQTFVNFLTDMGSKPTPKHTIERLDNEKGYEPGNCVWATRLQQNRNTRRNRTLTHDGLTLCISEWSARLGIPRRRIWERLRLGWTVEQALTTPRLKSKRATV